MTIIMHKLIKNYLPIIILIVWLFPVSNQLNTLNNNLLRYCYLLNFIILIVVFLFERYIYKRQLIIAGLILTILTISTILFYVLNKDEAYIAYGYLMNYLPFCVLINIKISILSKNNTLDILFIVICILLIIVGILTLSNNVYLEQLLKKFYVIHYPHIYSVMWEKHKTVTFFGTHSISCYIYFIIWWLLDYRMTIKKSILNYIFIVGILLNIIMCTSVSAILCVGIIVSYYYIKWIKTPQKYNILKGLIGILIALTLVFISKDIIIQILGSDKNGILGRFGSTGNLNYTLLYAITQIIPFGFCDLNELWLTDGGYYVHFIRGGFFLVFLFYFGLYRYMKINIRDIKRCNFLFLSLLLFEVGYQFTISLRFFMIMLFAVIYFNYLYNEKTKKIKICGMAGISDI